MRDALLVAIGAVPGAWLRLRMVNHFEPMVPKKHWGTFTVNVVQPAAPPLSPPPHATEPASAPAAAAPAASAAVGKKRTADHMEASLTPSGDAAAAAGAGGAPGTAGDGGSEGVGGVGPNKLQRTAAQAGRKVPAGARACHTFAGKCCTHVLKYPT